MPECIPSFRSYGLFGESTPLPDLLHCETIAERSALHGWTLAPHRHGQLHQLLLLQSGSGMVRLEGGACALGPMTLVNIAPGEVHAFSFKPGAQGYVATLSGEVLDEALANAPLLRRTLGRSFTMTADDSTSFLMAQLWREFLGDAPVRALMLRGLCATLLGCVARAATQGDAARSGTDAASSPSDLLHRFEELIEAHFPERWRVGDYARALAVTPTHLSRVTRAVTGESASRLIDARAMREARRSLAYTNMSVTTIAYTLGYADPAHFTRVFTRSAGLAPRDFRRQLVR